MQSRQNQVYAHYTLLGNFDPQAVTRATGIEPTATWQAGDTYGAAGKLRYAEDGWEVASNPELSLELEDHIQWVLDRLQPAWSTLCELGLRHDASVNAALYAYQYVPAMHLQSDMVRRIAELSADIDFDMYCLIEDEAP